MKRFIANIYILVWLVYCIHWFAAGYFAWIDRLSNAMLLLAFGLTLAIIIVNYKRYGITPYLVRGYAPLIFLFILYGIFYLFFGETMYVGDHGAVKKGSYIIGVMRTFLPVYAFYYMTKGDMIDSAMIRKWFLIIFAVLIYINSRVIFYKGSGEFTNNLGYNFTYLIPFVLLFKKRPVWMYILLAIILLFVLSCNKRGAIVIAILLSLYIMAKLFDLKTRRDRHIFLLSAAFLIAVSVFTSSYLERNDFLQDRIEKTLQGDDSGRTSIRNNIIDVMFGKSDIFKLVLGYGADGTLRIGSNYAHNDWLEILVNNGLVGVLVFFLFWYKNYILARRMRHDKDSSMLFSSIMIICFTSTLFSMFYSTTPFYVAMIWGYSIALYEKSTRRIAVG